MPRFVVADDLNAQSDGSSLVMRFASAALAQLSALRNASFVKTSVTSLQLLLNTSKDDMTQALANLLRYTANSIYFKSSVASQHVVSAASECGPLLAYAGATLTLCVLGRALLVHARVSKVMDMHKKVI